MRVTVLKWPSNNIEVWPVIGNVGYLAFLACSSWFSILSPARDIQILECLRCQGFSVTDSVIHNSERQEDFAPLDQRNAQLTYLNG